MVAKAVVRGGASRLIRIRPRIAEFLKGRRTSSADASPFLSLPMKADWLRKSRYLFTPIKRAAAKSRSLIQLALLWISAQHKRVLKNSAT
jgi:hypothetical protein